VDLVVGGVAAVRRVRAVLGAFELAGVDDFVAQPEVARDLNGELPVPLRITGAVGGHRQRAIAERAVGDIGEVSAVDAAAVGDDDRSNRSERLAKRSLLLDHSSQSSSSSVSSSSSDRKSTRLNSSHVKTSYAVF